jgi:hypothetical protein
MEVLMASTPTPADGAVIIGPLSKATQRRLKEVAPGRVEKVSEAPPTLVVEGKAEDPRALWERINNAVGPEAVVAPLLVDGEGNRLFPTGRLLVRFEERPTDDRLSAFAERHEVELNQRNKWAERQAEFTVTTKDNRFLPDIAGEMSKDPGVTKAWPEVQAAFRRG